MRWPSAVEYGWTSLRSGERRRLACCGGRGGTSVRMGKSQGLPCASANVGSLQTNAGRRPSGASGGWARGANRMTTDASSYPGSARNPCGKRSRPSWEKRHAVQVITAMHRRTEKMKNPRIILRGGRADGGRIIGQFTIFSCGCNGLLTHCRPRLFGCVQRLGRTPSLSVTPWSSRR